MSYACMPNHATQKDRRRAQDMEEPKLQKERAF